ncbi:MAG: hypothetical protein P8J70_12665 [Glaciecola sp.]|jgi:hypothetical protein|nr:hypothetical protein [Glaciecola sp.]MDG2100512.1 hypothetical protein [Glaciecola sp.]
MTFILDEISLGMGKMGAIDSSATYAMQITSQLSDSSLLVFLQQKYQQFITVRLISQISQRLTDERVGILLISY